MALATTGEATSLDDHERQEIVAVCAQGCADHSAQLLVGAGTNDTRTTIKGTKRWRTPLAAPPRSRWCRTTSGQQRRPVVAHFQLVAKRSTVPLVIYNIPYRTARGLGADALLDLAATGQRHRAQAGGRGHRCRYPHRAGQRTGRVRSPRRRRPLPLAGRVEGRRRRHCRLSTPVYRPLRGDDQSWPRRSGGRGAPTRGGAATAHSGAVCRAQPGHHQGLASRREADSYARCSDAALKCIAAGLSTMH